MIRLSEQAAIRPIKRLLASALAASALLCAPASIAATPADTAVTHVLLQARYELDLGLLRNAPAARASAATLAASLGRECRGVLAGEPKEEGFVTSEGPRTPRAEGERERSDRQQQTIAEELAGALATANAAPDRSAIEAYVTATTSLGWSDPRIAALVHVEAARLQEPLSVPPPDVCADMKAWAQSGYRLLSPASRAFKAARDARDEQVEGEASSSALLKPSEGAPELALLRRTAAVRKQLTAEIVKNLDVNSRLQRALGAPEETFERRRQASVLGRGKTRTGTTFTIREQDFEESHDSSCRHRASVEISETRDHENGVTFGTSGQSVCLEDTREREPSSECDDGEVSITAAVPANVRTVRLGLSDGHTITSRVVHVPRKDGGPAGVYVQAIGAERRRPVKLTELDRNGAVVRTVPVSAPRCKKEPQHVGPTSVSLAKGTVPGGQAFTIHDMLVGFRAHRAFDVTASVGPAGGGQEGGGDVTAVGSGAKKSFPWSRVKGCPPKPFDLIYGILEAPGDSVLARTPEGLVALTKLPLAPHLGAPGPLVYGAFVAMPSELIVRRSDGSTLYSESLAATAKEDSEFCEGLAEG